MRLGAPELLIILAIAVLIFGGNRLPELGRGIWEGHPQLQGCHQRRDLERQEGNRLDHDAGHRPRALSGARGPDTSSSGIAYFLDTPYRSLKAATSICAGVPAGASAFRAANVPLQTPPAPTRGTGTRRPSPARACLTSRLAIALPDGGRRSSDADASLRSGGFQAGVPVDPFDPVANLLFLRTQIQLV